MKNHSQMEFNFDESVNFDKGKLKKASEIAATIVNKSDTKIAKIVTTLTKRIESVQKKTDNISTELSGNWTHKRGNELANRTKTKVKLEGFIVALTRIRTDFENGNPKHEVHCIRSVSDIEFILYHGYPNPIDDETPDWRKEEYPKKLKRAEKLGLTCVKDNEMFIAVLNDYMLIELSEDQKKEKALAASIEALRGRKIPGFFPTPKPLIDKMFDYAQMFEKKNMDILEPEAGIGDLADSIKALDYGHKIDCVEINYSLCEILELKGYDTVDNRSIIDYSIGDFRYDRIIMNPPFEKGQDVEHITHCFNNFLKPGGILVSVASNSVMHNSQKKFEAFREFVAEHGQFIELEGGEFKGAEAFNSTGVSTVIVYLKKEL